MTAGPGDRSVGGRTLRDLLDAWGSAPEILVREIGRQLADRLAERRAQGAPPSDLRAEHVRIGDDHRVHLADDSGSRAADARPTSDLAALGALLHELLAGAPPGNAEPARVDAQRPEISPFLADVVAALLAPNAHGGLEDAAMLGDVFRQGEDSPWWRERVAAATDGVLAVPRVPVPRQTRLYGREAELGLLARCWDRARIGHGVTVLLTGEAGIGKSRLIDDFLRGLDARHAYLLYGSYAPAGGLGALSDAILQRFGRADLEARLRPYVRATPALVPALVAGVLGRPTRDHARFASDEALQAVLVQLLRGLADEQPLLWVVEDLQFAEPATRRRVFGLARGLAGRRVLLVLTARRSSVAAELDARGAGAALTRCELGRLTERDVTLLIRDLTRSAPLAERLGPRIAEASDGVPLFALELVRDLESRGVLARLPSGAAVETRPIEALQVPAAVRDLLAARLADLTKSERALLDVGAVQGYVFDPALTATVLEREPVEVLHDLGSLERRGGLVRTDGARMRFDHHQVQALVYGALSQPLREAYHAGVAHALVGAEGIERLDEASRVTLCRHLLKGGRGDEALPLLDDAIDLLVASHRHDEAVGLALDALEHEGLLVGAERAERLRRTGGRLHLLGRSEEEHALLEEAVGLADATHDLRLAARVRADLGRCLQRLSRYDEADAVLRRAIDEAVSAGDGEVRIRAVRRLGGVYYAQGRLEAAREQYESQRRLAAAQGHRLEEAHAVGNLGTIHSDQGRYEEARTCFERHLAVVEAEDDRLGRLVAHGNLGVLLSTQGRYEEAREHLERQLALARELGDRQGEARATGSLGYLAGMQGRFPEALALHEEHLAITREIGDRRGEGTATANLGNVFLNLGRHDEARTCLEDWLELSKEIGNRSGEARANGQLGYLCLVEGRTEQARVHLERWLEMARELGDRAGASYALGYLGDLELEKGRFDDARRLFEERLALSRELEDRRGEAIAHGGLGSVALARGRSAEAIAHHEQRLALARDLGERPLEAAACGSLGRGFAAQGRHLEAARWQDLALRAARELGDRRGEANALWALGRLADDAGDPRTARQRLQASLEISEGLGDGTRAVESRIVLAGLLADDEAQRRRATNLAATALAQARDLDAPGLVLRAACRLLRLRGGEPGEALAALAAHEDRLDLLEAIAVRLDLHEATDDDEHLRAVRRHLEELLARAPVEVREQVRAALAVCRRATAALGDDTPGER